MDGWEEGMGGRGEREREGEREGGGGEAGERMKGEREGGEKREGEREREGEGAIKFVHHLRPKYYTFATDTLFPLHSALPTYSLPISSRCVSIFEHDAYKQKIC